MKNISNSVSSFKKAQNFIPGGVNSPVRAFKAVGGTPIFIEKAKGAYLFDIDGNKYIEYINSWGPMILGHSNPIINEAVAKAIENSLSFGAPTIKEIEIAELICEMVPSAEKVRMVNSGTEATMSAIRLARGFTGRDKVIKMDGCYHGHGDSFLIAAGSGAATMGEPNSPGVTKGTAADTLIAPYNDLASVEALIAANPKEIAALILEPVAGNMGCVLPKVGYLKGLREICDREGIILIFDEVMTGFRLAPGGAQEVFGVTPDITTLGKIIGGGMPVGAYCGKKEIMDYVSPSGPVYQAGTLSGNPIAMSAGLAMLNQLKNNPGIYSELAQKTEQLHNGLKDSLKSINKNYTINRIGSMISLFFAEQPVSNFAEAATSDLEMFKKYFNGMLNNGVYLAPSQYETLFLSNALSNEDMEYTIATNDAILKEIHA